MSRLDQTKREAARLFKLAKHNPNNLLPINNLSHAKEYVAQMKGYSDWHAYEASVKKKDFVNNTQSENIQTEEINRAIQDKAYFMQASEYVIHTNTKREKPFVFMKQTHTPVELGSIPKMYSYSTSRANLTAYPAVVSGTTGAGKSEFMRILFSQYVRNNEGCVYVDFRGDISQYVRCYAELDQYNKAHELRLLNFSTNQEASLLGAQTNTIDPLNPLIGNYQVFIELFGPDVGGLIHGLSVIAQARGQLIDFNNIESMLMLPNLVEWSQTNFWNEQGTAIIKNYLEQIGLYEDADEITCESALFVHALNAMKAKLFISTMNNYKHVFSITPDVNILDVFKLRKPLFAILPALEKVPVGLTTISIILTAQIKDAASYMDNINQDAGVTENHWQNIILDSFYTIPSSFAKHVFMNLPSSSNWVFAQMDFLANKDSATHVLHVCNTYVLMKNECSYFPDYLKLKMIENIEHMPPMFFKGKSKDQTFNLNRLKCGEAVVFHPSSDLSYKLERMVLTYIPVKDVSTIKINTFN